MSAASAGTRRRIDFANAYYIKLGTGGDWVESSIRDDLMRIGWRRQSVDDLNAGNWSKIETEIRSEQAEASGKANPGAATRDLRALQTICASTPDDVWVTFRRPHLLWARLAGTAIEEDAASKFRRVAGWSHTDRKGKPLLINDIPGSISQLQGFRGTVCKVSQADALRRLLNDEPSPEFALASNAKDVLAEHVAQALRSLHWRDFEILVDLVFRNAGWRRTGVLGETTEGVDLELQEPITGDRYAVQVKSRSSLKEYERYVGELAGRGCRKLYYVVHSDENLQGAESTDVAELIPPNRLSHMVVDSGLVNWVLDRIR